MTTRDNRTTDSDSGLDRLLGGIERDVAPERDLWPDIAARMEADAAPGASRSATGWALGLAATVAMAAAVGWLALDLEPDSAAPIATTTPAPSAVAEPVAMPLPVLASFPGEGFAADRQRQVDLLQRHLEELPPGQREIIELNLGAIRDAIAEIDAALARNPDSDALASLLVQTYQHELETISAVNSIAARVRNDL